MSYSWQASYGADFARGFHSAYPGGKPRRTTTAPAVVRMEARFASSAWHRVSLPAVVLMPDALPKSGALGVRPQTDDETR
ncbi:hypothetical protein GCM10023170_005790 [Phytohabitans houttuyneae]|uniref:Uncharacterized protein n=1 Tax=Phytohabitans houttuyneae TaxID=1076126 RepID=A0A6V8K9X8_9ACTN|nr:hypothetical protein Phou_031290 [Phytohabitans houttuyneae]